MRGTLSLLHRFLSTRRGQLALLLGLPLLAFALFGPSLVPQNPYDLAALDILDSRLPPGSPAATGHFTYWLGSDDQGRDMVSALAYGLGLSLAVAGSATLVGAVLGTLVGLWSGFRGGWVDGLVMRLVDLQLSFPALLLALVLLALTGPGLDKIVLALALSQWAYFARCARGAALGESRKDYVASARLLGLSAPALIRRHLLPNCLPPLLVLLPQEFAGAITLEATLSFLGLGTPPGQPTLGRLVANGFPYLFSGQTWISLTPGLVLTLTVVAVTLTADRLGELLQGD